MLIYIYFPRFHWHCLVSAQCLLVESDYFRVIGHTVIFHTGVSYDISSFLYFREFLLTSHLLISLSMPDDEITLRKELIHFVVRRALVGFQLISPKIITQGNDRSILL